MNKISQSFLDEVWENNDEDRQEGIIDERNYEDYLADNVDEKEPDLSVDDYQDDYQDDFLGEIPTQNEQLGIPEDTKEITYANAQSLINDGIAYQELIGFDYTNRHGSYAGWRTVEPHYIFVAQSTGNHVLVSFDRDINDIRAFIIGNIHPNGVRYEDVPFELRPEIIVGSIGVLR